MNLHSWELIKYLTLRDIKSRYKQSFLGYFWVILNPFFQMLIMSFVLQIILKANNLGVPFPLFLYAGMLPWIFFTNGTTAGMSALIDGGGLLKKIYFPREILIYSAILAKVFDLALSYIVFYGMMLFFHVPLTLHALWFIPIFLIQVLFMAGISFFLSVANLFLRDIQYIYALILQLAFYLTPIMYATEFFPEKYRWIFQINPLSVFINAYRQVLLAHANPNWSSLGIGALVASTIFVAGYIFFKRAEGKFADVV